MKLLNDKRKHRYKIILRKICWSIHDFMKYLRENMFCYYELDIQHIREEIHTQNEKAEKFDAVEQIAPKIQEKLQENTTLQHENQFLRERLFHIEELLTELYFSDITNNHQQKKELFKYLIANNFFNIDAQRLSNSHKKGE